LSFLSVNGGASRGFAIRYRKEPVDVTVHIFYFPSFRPICVYFVKHTAQMNCQMINIVEHR
jgi:hypothetical protein